MRIGVYRHENPDIEAFIRKNFEQMDGSLALSFEELISASWLLGNAVSNWGVEVAKKTKSLRLIDLAIVSPKLYNYRGSGGALKEIIYRSAAGTDTVPYGGENGRLVHVSNARHLSFRDPRGIATLARVMPAHKAWKIIIGEALIAAQRQATPILVGYSDSAVTVPLLDSTGQPLLDTNGNTVTVQASRVLLEQMQSVTNQSVISTDLKNKIEAINQQTNGELFLKLLAYFQSLILNGLLFPETILSTHGSGDSNLNSGQRETLELVIDSLVNQIKEALIENCLRWLIYWQFGEQESYGYFELDEPPQTVSDRMSILDRLITGSQTGFFPASDELVSSRGRSLAGIIG
jgi:hypothetical protein